MQSTRLSQSQRNIVPVARIFLFQGTFPPKLKEESSLYIDYPVRLKVRVEEISGTTVERPLGFMTALEAGFREDIERTVCGGTHKHGLKQ